MIENMNDNLYVFTDKKGNKWDVTLTLAGARRISKADLSQITDLKIDILNPDRQFLGSLLANSSLLFAIIWCVVQPQVEKNLGINPELNSEEAELAFLECMDGDSIKSAKEKFWEALINFTPAQKTALQKMLELTKLAEVKTEKALLGTLPDLQKVLDKELEKGLKKLRAEIANIGEQ